LTVSGRERKIPGDAVAVPKRRKGGCDDPHLTAHGLTIPLEDPVQAIRNEFVSPDELEKKLVVVNPGECF
jgi:hypothetical protein